MGRCHEFGLQIREGCGHPMQPGENACSCPECGTVCGGRFAGCPDVWARGVQSEAMVEPPATEVLARPINRPNGTGRRRAGGARVRAPEARTVAREEAVVESQPPSASVERAPRPTPQPGASAAALRWLEGAFSGLRDELHSLRSSLNQQQATLAELVSGLTQQQVLLAELVETRSTDLRLMATLEALPQAVEDATLRAVAEGQHLTVDTIVGSIDTIVASVETSHERAAAALSQALDGLEARLQRASTRDPQEVAAELRAFLENDVVAGSVVAAIATQAAGQSLRSEMRRQLPDVLSEVAAGSDERMEKVVERLDKLLTKALRAGARAQAKAAKAPASPATHDDQIAAAAQDKATAAKKTKATSKSGTAKKAAAKNASSRAAASKATPSKARAATENGSSRPGASKTGVAGPTRTPTSTTARKRAATNGTRRPPARSPRPRPLAAVAAQPVSAARTTSQGRRPSRRSLGT
jgi:hypothetical protein